MLAIRVVSGGSRYKELGKHCIKLKDRTIKWKMKLNMDLNVKQTKEDCHSVCSRAI